jgi:hypothetical protein
MIVFAQSVEAETVWLPALTVLRRSNLVWISKADTGRQVR